MQLASHTAWLAGLQRRIYIGWDRARHKCGAGVLIPLLRYFISLSLSAVLRCRSMGVAMDIDERKMSRSIYQKRCFSVCEAHA